MCRIDSAEISLHARLQESLIVRLLKSSTMRELDYLMLLVKDDPIYYVKHHHVPQKRISPKSATTAPMSTFADGEEPELNAADKKELEAKLNQLRDENCTILESLIPSAEHAPQQCLDRERRTAMRFYRLYIAELMQLQQARRTGEFGSSGNSDGSASEIWLAPARNHLNFQIKQRTKTLRPAN